MKTSISSDKQLVDKVYYPRIVSFIVKLFQRLDDDRSTQLSDYQYIKDIIYNNSLNSSDDWRSNVSLPDIYELANTFKAHVWENLLSSPDSMFDVTGKTPEAEQYAPLQKATLANAFHDMNINEQLEKALNYLTEAGEAILFIGWETKYKQIRRYDTDNKGVFAIQNKIIYDGAKIKAISPENFVFDKAQRDNWDACPKIYRSLFTADEILTNQSYSLSSEIKDLLTNSNTSTYPPNTFASSTEADTNMFEVLEYWGNISLDDGSVLRNVLITVLNKEYIIRIEANPYVINPFVYASLMEDPTTKRGISPLRVAIVLNNISSGILNKQVDALSLITNPPYLAPKGAFTGSQEVSPGKIIEYDTSLLPQMPTPLSFNSALQGWDFINFFNQSIESSTGIFKNMAGDINRDVRTATEINHTVDGQSIRLNMSIDSIFRKLILPMVEAVADLSANFKLGSEVIPVCNKGKMAFLEVHDAVRQADYAYSYGDKNSALKKQNDFKDLFSIIGSFAKIQEVSSAIDWIQCFKYALEQYGIENSQSFIKE